MSRPDPLADLRDELDALRRDALYRPLVVMHGPQTRQTTMDGRPVISLSSNDYLGLATHPHLVEAAIAAVRELGVGSGAVRTIAGTMELHEELERRLAACSSTPRRRSCSSPGSPPTAASSRPSPATGPDRQRRAQPRLDHRRRAAVASRPSRLCPQGRGRPGAHPARRPRRGRAGRGATADPGHHRRCLQHGRRHRAAARHLRCRRPLRGHGHGR